jgi:hypothetical protein
MNCPYCNTPNDPSHQYCQACGKPLSLHPPTPQSSARNMLWIVTGRLLVSLLFLWLMRGILNDLDFIQNTTIPDLNLAMTTVISLAVFITIIVLLIGFIGAIGRLWPQAFPRFYQASIIFTVILQLILLNQLYKGLQLVIPLVTRDQEVMIISGVVLAAIALILVVRAFVITYQALPNWFASWQISLAAAPAPLASQEDLHQ